MPGIIKRKFLSSAAMASLLALTACGGGGGSSTPSAPVTQTISALNYAEVYFASLETQDALLNMAMNELPNIVIATRVSARDTGNKTCSSGGSANLEFSDNDNNFQLSAGDTYTTTYTDCNDGTGITYVSGSITGTITSASAVPDFLGGADLFASTWGVVETLEFNNLETRNSFGDTSLMNGSTNISLSNDTTTQVFSSALTTVSNLTGSTNLGEQLLTASYAPSSTFAFELDRNTGDYNVDHDFSMNILRSGSTITLQYVNDPVFSGQYTSIENVSLFDTRPTSGRLIATSPGQPTVRVTALSNGTHLTIETDSNNDGYYESSITVPWSMLSL